ncbi:MAG: GNAT family N-acetyltransferase [Candidatus Dormibacteria bacterium]
MATRSMVEPARLTEADQPAVQALLDHDPVGNVYLRSELRQGIRFGEWWGVRDGEVVRATLLAGALAVPCVTNVDDATTLAESACVTTVPRMLVGPRQSVMAMHHALGRRQQAREVRDPQPLLTLHRDDHVRGVESAVRRSRRSDVDALVIAAAQMHREEMGVDPMRVDAAAWRARMVWLIDRGWSWVWVEGGRAIFKAELSAWTPEVVQIQGVFTDPAWRRRGVARAGLTAVCRALLEEVPVCSLYVNHFNATALRLYERLGFRRAGDFATVFY